MSVLAVASQPVNQSVSHSGATRIQVFRGVMSVVWWVLCLVSSEWNDFMFRTEQLWLDNVSELWHPEDDDTTTLRNTENCSPNEQLHVPEELSSHC